MYSQSLFERHMVSSLPRTSHKEEDHGIQRRKLRLARPLVPTAKSHIQCPRKIQQITIHIRYVLDFLVNRADSSLAILTYCAKISHRILCDFHYSGLYMWKMQWCNYIVINTVDACISLFFQNYFNFLLQHG